MDQPLSPRAAAMRSMLLQSVDAVPATDAANQLVDQVNVALNDAGLNIATSLFARALLARAIIHVAADWWHDISGQPSTVTYEAMMSLVQDLPPPIDGSSFNDPAIAVDTP